MHDLYQQGGTLEDVAEAFGITRERVRQIFKSAGLHVRSVGETRQLQRAKLEEDLAERVIACFKEEGDVRAAARKTGVSVATARSILSEGLPNYALMRKARPPRRRYSDAEVLGCLREASDSLGGVLTTAAYTRFARGRRFRDGRKWPTHQTAFKRFGSWRAALAAAGLRSNPASAIAGQRLFEPGHCIDALREVKRELGRIPTAAEYDAYARKLGGAIPSLATLRNRFGSWQEALRLAFVTDLARPASTAMQQAASEGSGGRLIDAVEYLRSLIGTTIPTLTGKPNRVLRVESERVIVGTQRSPTGQPVSIDDVQAAMDMLERDGEVVIDVKTVGYRSAFIGAVLASLPGASTHDHPRRVRWPRPGLSTQGRRL